MNNYLLFGICDLLLQNFTQKLITKTHKKDFATYEMSGLVYINFVKP